MDDCIIIPTTGQAVYEGGVQSERYGNDSQDSDKKGDTGSEE